MQRIVVVDDHPDVCAFMQAALESAGYEVRTALQGAQALALMRERRADLLITDLFIPGQGGFETIWRCRTAELIGVAATLPKPFAVDQLLDTVRRVLQRR